MTPSGSTPYIDSLTIPVTAVVVHSGNEADQGPAAFSGPLALALAAAKAVGTESRGVGQRLGTRAEGLPREALALPQSGDSLPEDHGPNGPGMSEAAGFEDDAHGSRVRPGFNESQAELIWQSRNDPLMSAVFPSHAAHPASSDRMQPSEPFTGEPPVSLGPDTVMPGSPIDDGPATFDAVIVESRDLSVLSGSPAIITSLDSAIQALPTAPIRASARGIEAEARSAVARTGAPLDVRSPSQVVDAQPVSLAKDAASENAPFLSHLALTRAFDPTSASDSLSGVSPAQLFEQVATRQSPEAGPTTEAGIEPSVGTQGLPEASVRLSENLNGVTTLPMGSGSNRGSSVQPTFQPLSTLAESDMSGPESFGNGLDAPPHGAREALDRAFGAQAHSSSDHSIRTQVQALSEETGQAPTNAASVVRTLDWRLSDALGPVAATSTTDGAGFARIRPRTVEQMSLEGMSPVLSRPGDSIMGSVSPPGPLEALPILEPAAELGTSLLEGGSMEDVMEKTIVRHIAWMTRAGVSEAQLRLDPQELGSLDIRVSVRDDQATVSFAATEATVREVLQEQTERLRELLSERGLALAESNIRNGFGSERGRTSDQDVNARGPEPDDTQDSDSTTSPERTRDGRAAIDAYA